MAWSWSHTTEAYVNARNNVQRLEREKLEVIFAEWEGKKGDNLHENKYERALKKAAKLPDDVLADYIWDKMEAQATCDNGGFNAWCCPFGCGCHTVSFDSEAEKEEEEKRKKEDEEWRKEGEEFLTSE